MKLTFYLTLCVHIFTEVWCDLPKESLVTIPNLGQIRGLQMTSASGTIFYAYRGIPYAKPPIGELRFRVKILYCLEFGSSVFLPVF